MFWHLYLDAGLEQDGIYLTIDGRLGIIKEFEDFRLARRVALSVRKSKLLTVQFQQYPEEGRYLVSMSAYFDSPEVSLSSALFSSEPKKVKSSLDSLLEYFLSLQERLPGKDVTDFTIEDVPDFRNYQLFRLKVAGINKESVLYSDGFCEITFAPGVEIYPSFLYLTSRTLVDMLQSKLYTIEYIEKFKEKAATLWWPLAANPFLAKTFRL